MNNPTPDKSLPRRGSIRLRYFVDERTGCIAVRDRTLTDSGYSGLWPDTEGVVFFAGGIRNIVECPMCHNRGDGGWMIRDESRAEANRICSELNAAEVDTHA